jgi:hypothetical protein
MKFVGLDKDEFLRLVPGALPHHRVQMIVPSMKFIQLDQSLPPSINAYLSRHCFPLRLELCTFSPKTSAMRVHFFVPWSLTRSTIRLSSYNKSRVRYLLSFRGIVLFCECGYLCSPWVTFLFLLHWQVSFYFS